MKTIELNAKNVWALARMLEITVEGSPRFGRSHWTASGGGISDCTQSFRSASDAARRHILLVLAITLQDTTIS